MPGPASPSWRAAGEEETVCEGDSTGACPLDGWGWGPLALGEAQSKHEGGPAGHRHSMAQRGMAPAQHSTGCHAAVLPHLTGVVQVAWVGQFLAAAQRGAVLAQVVVHLRRGRERLN